MIIKLKGAYFYLKEETKFDDYEKRKKKKVLRLGNQAIRIHILHLIFPLLMHEERKLHV